MAQTERDPRTDPQFGDLCTLDGVIWYVTEVTDDLVYLDSSADNEYNVWRVVDDEYITTADAEIEAGGDAGKEPYGACWLREDWASAPGADWTVFA